MSMTNSRGTAAVDDRVEGLARAWLTEHKGAFVRLHPCDIHEITFRLIEAGVEPTIDAVRCVNGRRIL